MGLYPEKTPSLDRELNMRVLIAIPVYNHGGTLRMVVSQAVATGYPVLVVDDGSTDGGIETLVDLDCRIYRMGSNCGKGAAILAAARIADQDGFKAMVTVDADGQHNPGEVENLVKAAANSSWPALVIGARQMIQDTVPGSSHFGRDFSNFWVRLECGADLSDTQSGMRLYPVREILQLQLNRRRYDFEVEAIVKLVWAGVAVSSVDVTVHYPDKKERISHFHKLFDNARLSLLHASLVIRRLLPLPHRRLAGDPPESIGKLTVKHPLRTLKNLCRENASPLWLATAVWLGIFLGALPLIAVHTLVIIYAAHRLHLNKIAAVAASQFCMPPVVPALCIEVGYFMRNGEFIVDLSWQRWLLEIHVRVYDWLLGSLLVGPLLGLAGALIVYSLAQRMQKMQEST